MLQENGVPTLAMESTVKNNKMYTQINNKAHLKG